MFFKCFYRPTSRDLEESRAEATFSIGYVYVCATKKGIKKPTKSAEFEIKLKIKNCVYTYSHGMGEDP